ncbi:MAG: helix-turn-helix transcriptional regulator [Muribaculaceae bacterium]
MLSQTDSVDEAVAILESLRKDSTATKSSHFHNLILRNLYIFTGSTKYVEEAYDMIKDKKDYQNEKILYLYYLIRISLNNGNTDLALDYIQQGIPHLDACSRLDFKSRFLFAVAETYEKLGNTEKAYEFVSQGIETYSQNVEKDRKILMSLSDQNKINAIQQGRAELERLRQRNQTRIIIITLSVLLCVVVTYFMIRIRTQRQRQAQLQLEYERDYNKLKLESVALIAQEKENLITGIGKMIESLRKNNAIPSEAAQEISNAIKIHLNSDDDRAAFQNLHDLIKPEFANRLRQEFPALTDNNIRFLSYIAIGLSNKEIARIMMINHQSVNNNRHRLKQKLGLNPDDNLDEFIRKYN